MKHKHADVLIAIAEGKKVQWKSTSCINWQDASFMPFTPLVHVELEWRIKPEPKPDVVKYIHFDADSGGDCLWITDDLESSQSHWDLHLKVVIDGETGKLKKAEVL